MNDLYYHILCSRLFQLYILSIVAIFLSIPCCYAQDENNSEYSEDDDFFLTEDTELIIEADRIVERVQNLGRDISFDQAELRRASELGIIEDLMTSIKQLPGVGYSGSYNARPSIRGGDPRDFSAVYNGFYLENPFHWDGMVSIFDPRMAESATLSHGVFSARYGKTSSGLLQVRSRKNAGKNTEFEVGLSTSAADLLVSKAINSKNESQGGGILAAGRITYLDAYIALAKLVTDRVDMVSKSPYIRNLLLNFNYTLSNAADMNISAFFGNDGIGLKNSVTSVGLDATQGFLIFNFLLNPVPFMLAEINLGGGFYNSDLQGDNNLADNLFDESGTMSPLSCINISGNFQFNANIDFDLKHGLIVSAGIDEQYSTWKMTSSDSRTTLAPNTAGLFNSFFAIAEWKPKSFIKAEAGLRLDHLYFLTDRTDFKSGVSTPLLANPRLNVDLYLPLKNNFINKLTLTAGSGFFASLPRDISSYNIDVTYVQKQTGADDLKQTRAWTSIAGIMADFLNVFSLSGEVYYKILSDRWYTGYIASNRPAARRYYFFNGEGEIWGLDFMLRKYESRYFDGWISYSFNDTRSRNALSGRWFHPMYHRYHTLNLNLNIKPAKNFNISVHLSYASGRFKNGGAELNGDGREKPVTLLDLKFSYFGFNMSGKTQAEIYFAVENVLSIFNKIEDMNENLSINFQLPIPVPSIGFKWSY